MSKLRQCCITPVFDSKGYLKKSKFRKLNATKLIGIGGLINLDTAIKFQDTLSCLILFDFDPNLVGENGFWSLFQEAITTSLNKEDFIQKLQKSITENEIFDINSLHARKISETDYKLYHFEALTLSTSEVIIEIRGMEWFKSDKNFNFIKKLFNDSFESLNGGVKIMMADLTNSNDLKELARLSVGLASESVVINFSNVLDFILGRGYSGWNVLDGKPFSEEINIIEAKQNAESLRTNFLEPLIKKNVYIIDNVFTHDLMQIRGKKVDGHYHATVATPLEIIEYRLSNEESPGMLNKKSFREVVRKISATHDCIDVIINPNSSKLLSTPKAQIFTHK